MAEAHTNTPPKLLLGAIHAEKGSHFPRGSQRAVYGWVLWGALHLRRREIDAIEGAVWETTRWRAFLPENTPDAVVAAITQPIYATAPQNAERIELREVKLQHLAYGADVPYNHPVYAAAFSGGGVEFHVYPNALVVALTKAVINRVTYESIRVEWTKDGSSETSSVYVPKITYASPELTASARVILIPALGSLAVLLYERNPNLISEAHKAEVERMRAEIKGKIARAQAELEALNAQLANLDNEETAQL